MKTRLLFALLLLALASYAVAAEPSPFAPNEAELWQKIIDRNKPGSTIRDFKYIKGVPNICLIETTTPQSTALGNILCYLSRLTNNALCCFSGSYDAEKQLERIARDVGWPITNALSKRAASSLMELVDERRSKLEKEEVTVAKNLCLLEAKYNKKMNGKMVIFSGGVSDSALLDRYVGNAKDIKDIKKRLIRFAEKKDYRLDVQISDSPDTFFFSAPLLKGIPPLLVLEGKQFCTVVGCFVDNDNKYLIMHDPCSAAQQFNRTDFGGFCMYDCEGELTNKMQAGVHLYQLGINKSNLAALVVVKWTQDDDAMKEIFKKEIRRLQK